MSSTSVAPVPERPQMLHSKLLQRTGRAATAAIPTPTPIPIPLPIVGSRFLIWKQDPSVHPPGVRLSYVPSLVLDGPKDVRITTELPNVTPVHANASRDFVFPPGTPEADCAHTFAVVRETLTMYERIRGAAIPWAWNIGGNTDPLAVFPRAGVTENAFYSRGLKALKFFYFTPANATQPILTCRSLDVVAHECGHAVLDGMKPGWLGAANPPQTGGLHEAFGDLTAIFLACSQLDQVEAAVAQTKANLHDRNFLAALAEQFGAAEGFPEGLRNADNDLKLSQVGNEVHSISQVFTGGIYDVLADIFAFEKNRQAAVKDPARVLLEVASNLCRLLVEAIKDAPPAAATYADVVNRMLDRSSKQGDPVIYRTFLRNRFTYREVVVSPVPLTAMSEGRMNLADPNYVEGQDLLKMEARKHPADQAPQDRSGCCGTMQLPEYTLGDQKKLEKGAVIADEDVIAAEISELKKMFAR